MKPVPVYHKCAKSNWVALVRDVSKVLDTLVATGKTLITPAAGTKRKGDPIDQDPKRYVSIVSLEAIFLISSSQKAQVSLIIPLDPPSNVEPGVRRPPHI